MFSLVVTIVAIALAAALAVAAVYYGHTAYTRTHVRANAAKAITQSAQVLGAAELFQVDFDRWPDGVDELLEKGYLRENPQYLPTAQKKPTPEQQAAAKYQGAPLVASAPTLTLSGASTVDGTSGYETIGGEGSTSGGTPNPDLITNPKPPQPRWDAPVKNRPTYWVIGSTSEEVCKEINLQARGDNGIYRGVVPGLVTQCFGIAQPYTVVTTRDATAGYWRLLLEHWNDPELFFSEDYAWSVKPDFVSSTYQYNPLPLGPGELPDFGDITGRYLEGQFQVAANGEYTNKPLVEGPLTLDVLFWGDGPGSWVGPTGSAGGSGSSTGGAGGGDSLDPSFAEGGGTQWGTGGSGIQIKSVTTSVPGMDIQATCPAGAYVLPGVTCSFTFTPPALPAGATTCSTYSFDVLVETSIGTLKVPVSSKVCPPEPSPSPVKVKVEGLEAQDELTQWWFNDTRVGAIGTKWVRLTNTGTAPLYTDTPSLALKAPFSVASNECPSLLWPGSSCLVLMHFTPTQVKLYGENLYPFVLRSDLGEHRYFLNGYGRPALTYGAEVSPASLFIAPAYDGGQYVGTVTVKNTGNGRLNFDKAPEVESESAAFSLRTTTCTSSGLSGYSSCIVQVNLTPKSTGSVSGILRISTVEGGKLQVPLGANVNPPLALAGGLLRAAYPNSSYLSNDLRSFATVQGRTSYTNDLKLTVTGLPYGLYFNPTTYKIEGRVGAGAAVQDYKVKVVASYMEGKYSVSAILQLPVKAVPESDWADGSSVQGINDPASLKGTGFVEMDYLKRSQDILTTRKVVLRNSALKDKALVKGKFKVSGDLKELLAITGLDYIRADGAVTSCGASIAADGSSGSCTKYPPDYDSFIGVLATLRAVVNQPQAKPGTYKNYVSFEPDADSSVRAPSAPFMLNQPWRNDQTLLITAGGSGAAASGRLTELDFGSFAANSTVTRSLVANLRGTTAYARLGGTWTIEGDPGFFIARIGTQPKPDANTSNAPSSAYYCDGVNESPTLEVAQASCRARNHPGDSSYWSDMQVTVTYKAQPRNALGTTESRATLTFHPDTALGTFQAVAPLVVNLKASTVLDQGISLTKGFAGYTTSDAGDVNFGAIAGNAVTTLTQRFMIRQKNASGQVGGTWKLEGAPNFEITKVGTHLRGQGDVNGFERLCQGRGNALPLSTEKTSAYCTGGHPARYVESDLYVEVGMKASATAQAGEYAHSAKLTFVPDAAYPATEANSMSVNLSGVTKFSSSVYFTLATKESQADTPEVSYGELPPANGATGTKRYYVRAVNQFAALKGTFKLEGANNFTIDNAGVARTTVQISSCKGKSVVGQPAGTRSVTCEGYAPGDSEFKELFVDVTFKPVDDILTEGVHRHEAVLTFEPESAGSVFTPLNSMNIPLTGNTRLDMAASITTGVGYNANPASSLDLGTAVPTYATWRDYIVYLRGDNVFGKLKGKWVLEGSPNFYILEVGAVSRGYTAEQQSFACANRSGTAVGLVREVECEARYHPYTQASYSDLYVRVRYRAETTTQHGVIDQNAVLKFVPDDSRPLAARSRLQLGLVGHTLYGQVALLTEGVGTSSADIVRTVDLGELPANWTARRSTKRIYLRGTNNGAALAGTWYIDGPSNFSISTAATAERATTASTGYCLGTTSAAASGQGPVFCEAGHPARDASSDLLVDVTYVGRDLSEPGSEVQTARLYFVPKDANAVLGMAPLEVQLTGTTTYGQTSFVTTSTAVPTAHTSSVVLADVPAFVPNSYSETVVYLRGTTPHGLTGAQFSLGANSKFTITRVSSADRGATTQRSCRAGGGTFAEGVKSTTCQGYHPASYVYSDVAVTLRFTPGAVEGEGLIPFNDVLTVQALNGYPDNGLAAPVSVALSARAATGRPAVITTGAPGAAAQTSQDFGELVANRNAAVTNRIYLRSDSTYGRFSGKWTIKGDSAFQIVTVGSASSNSYSITQCVGKSTYETFYSQGPAPCLAYPPSTNSDLFVDVRYLPPATTRFGGESHQAVLTFTPDVGYPAFERNGASSLSMTLTGKSLFGQQVELRDSAGNEVGGATINFGDLIGNRSAQASQTVVLNPLNDRDYLKGTWSLTGSSAFGLDSVGLANKDSPWPGVKCVGATSYAVVGGVSGTCEGYHPLLSVNSRLAVYVYYRPQGILPAGVTEQTAVLTFTPDPNHPVSNAKPLSVTLRGSVQNGSTAVMVAGDTRSTDVALNSQTVDFGEVPANIGRSASAVVSLNSLDTRGHLVGEWWLEGSDEFSIQLLNVMTPTGGVAACVSGSSTVFGGAGPHTCYAQRGDYTYIHQRAVIAFTPKTATHNGLKESTAVLKFRPLSGYPTTPAEGTVFSINLKGSSRFGAPYVVTQSRNFENASLTGSTTTVPVFYQGKPTLAFYIRTDGSSGMLKGNISIENDPYGIYTITNVFLVARGGSAKVSSCMDGTALASYSGQGPYACAANSAVNSLASDIGVHVTIDPSKVIPYETGTTRYPAKLRYTPADTHPGTAVGTGTLEMFLDVTVDGTAALSTGSAQDLTLHSRGYDFGKVSAGTGSVKTTRIFLRTAGTGGVAKGTWTLTGDANFYFVKKGTAYRNQVNSSYLSNCTDGTTTASGSTAACAGTPFYNGTATDLYVDVAFKENAMAAPGTQVKSTTLTFTPDANTPLAAAAPLQLLMVGSVTKP